MKRRTMSEASAWRLVAEEMATRQLYIGVPRFRRTHGLCWALDTLADDVIPSALVYRMRSRISQNMLADPTDTDGFPRRRPATGCGFAFDYYDRDVRVLAALNLAEQARQECAR